MDVLLILNSRNGRLRVVVRAESVALKNRIASLLEEKRSREAFDLLKDKAEVRRFLPEGAKLASIPDLTLVEDLI